MIRLLAFVLVLLLTALQPTAAQTPATNAKGLLMSPSELAAALKTPNLVLLHVADRPAVFEEAHLPGARFLRYADFAVDGPEHLGSELPPPAQMKQIFEAVGVSDSSHVVVYGASTVAAARAFFTLDAMGHPHVSLLDGGLRAWRAENRPTESGTVTAPPKGNFTPVLNAAKLASAQQIQQQTASRAIALVDVRPDAEYLGTDGGMGGMHAAGHIDGAAQLPWDTLVGSDGKFLPREQLQAKLAAARAAPGKPIVAYCMVGMRASVVYFVARHLGYEARLYDGSIVDWTQKKLPVKTGRP
jgi:thiosulfate/3-mercaptopyruvate sulfurtransferase